MPIDDDASYDALKARDARFDGLFFTGVLTTGIYCRPICPARTPKRENCRFFPTAEAAEKAGLRPCLRCRPELAPGNAPVDHAQRITRHLIERLHEEPGDDTGLEDIAAGFGISSRQLRRIVQQELGVSPIELIQTRRLLLAKQLLTETWLPITEIAFASGFASLRRFNDAFVSRYRMPPGRLRKEAAAGAKIPADLSSSTLRLSYRAPYDWEGTLAFLRGRMISGVECITGEIYARTVRIGTHTGLIRVNHTPRHQSLAVEFSHTLVPVLPALLGRLRHQFDLMARPDPIAEHLSKDPILQPLVAVNPGLRVPGTFDGFEMAVRAILGQQVTVKGATTLAGRFATAFGESISTPIPGLDRLTPLASSVAASTPDAIASLGIIGTRARSLIALAQACANGIIDIDPASDPQRVIQQLEQLPGIGSWTAHYIAMRALRWPDAFPADDLVLRKRLGGLTKKQTETASQPWRPWRSYAVMHLWRNGT